MGSLSREKTYRILWASFALILLVGLLSPSVRASNGINEQKLHRLEVLGLDVEDPTIKKASDGAHALHSVDVFPKGDNINVVIQLSDLPSYKSSIYEDKRRLVVDLYNTINVAPSAEFALNDADPIRMVRNAQFKVSPSIISRVVLELGEGVTPNIRAEGSNLVISVPMGEGAPSIELPIEMLQPLEEPAAEEPAMVAAADEAEEAVESELVADVVESEADVAGETIAVPTLEVETETPEIEIVVARVVTEYEPPAEPQEISAETGSATKEVAWAEALLEIEEIAVEEDAAVEMEDAIESLISGSEEVEPAEIESVEIVEAVVEEIPEAEEAEEITIEIVEPVEEAPVEIEPAPEAVEIVEAVVEEIPEAEEAEEITIEIVEPVEEAPVEIEPAPEAVEIVEAVVEEIPEAEEVESADAEEAAEALNGMFSEMVETMESVAAEEAAPVEPPTEDLGRLFGEMFAEMAAMMEAETAMEEVADEPEAEVSETVDPDKTLVSLNFREADLSAVLDILARKGNLNIIAGKGIRGDVTVRLVDVPLDVALNAILNVNGYGYLKTDNIIRILPLSEIGDVVNMSTETYRLSYAKAEDAKKTLDSFLTSSGSIEVDKRTNMLVVTDIPGNKERIEKLIKEIDKRVQQVLIEVIILDSVLSDDADLGVSWGILNTNDNSPNSKEAARLDEEDPFPDQFAITLPTGANALNVVFGTMFDDLDLNVFIDAVVSDSDSRVLANPKILTLNNELATIEIIMEFPYNDVTQTSSGGQLSNITFKEIGTKLEVRPQITHDEHVILWVAPEQNSIAGTTAIGVPIVDTRKAETTLIVKNHQTIVMGGLRENRNVNTITKVPFLGDLPGVKYAFRSVQSDKADSELLVFLTVHIVESPELMPEERIKAEELANMPRSPNSTIELIRP